MCPANGLVFHERVPAWVHKNDMRCSTEIQATVTGMKRYEHHPNTVAIYETSHRLASPAGLLSRFGRSVQDGVSLVQPPCQDLEQRANIEAATGFLSIPGELRNQVYALLLVSEDEHINPCRSYRRPTLFPVGLFRINKTIHVEASAVFYTKNCFDLTSASSEDVALFLRRIGSANAANIGQIYMNAPRFQNLDRHDITVHNDDLSVLASIQRSCVNLNSITTSLYSTKNMGTWLDNLEDYEAATNALKLANVHLTAISSVTKITLEVSKDTPSDLLKRCMHKFGWSTHTIDSASSLAQQLKRALPGQEPNFESFFNMIKLDIPADQGDFMPNSVARSEATRLSTQGRSMEQRSRPIAW
ncbi:uncharacterized protein JN550_013378 [Neoarthrinium moseri]|uniref:uncharacterized protein n=1 Tax=Neoarthrinium moseri TaxID=1658444 RepID=UPI001FDD270F|nr:uncharacterized protein JN550_013378 [Neoarthrinium moseri]KAI1857243.1 hypothetical protein JN550_013378 [Neoarthrinium moseri]